MTEKKYQLTPGKCADCCLLFNCFKNKENMKKFLAKIKLNCEGGFCVQVVVVEPELDFKGEG